MHQDLRWRNLLTGIFFLLGLIVLAAGLLIVGTNQNVFSRTFTIHTYLPDTQTLAEGTSVTLSGIEIGVIQKIDLATHEGRNMVKFDLKLRSEYQSRITSSSTCMVKSIGVLGDKFMEISLGNAGETPVRDGDVLTCLPAVDWEKVARDISGSITATLNRVEGVLYRMEKGEGTMGVLLNDSTLARRLESSLENLDATLSAVSGGKGTLGRLVHDRELHDDLASVLNHLDEVSSRLAGGEGTLGRLIADSTLYVSAAGAATGADTAMARLNSGRGTAGRLLNDEKAYEELHRAIQDLRLLLIDMRKNPGRYVRFSVF
jgi:phospholipid/cholesterol/gamma-HCH transport system substrate-binding protein